MKTAFTSILIPLCAFANAQDSSKITLPEGTLIKAKLNADISGNKANTGDIVEFTLAEPVIIGNTVFLHAGAKITGTVTEAAHNKALGKKGKLALKLDYLYLPNNKVVRLRSEQKANPTGNGVAVAAGTVLLTPLFLLVHGQQAKLKAGTVFNAYIDETITL